MEIKIKKIEIEGFILINEINNIDLINKLKNVIKQKVKEVPKNQPKTHVKGEFTGFQSLNNHALYHEFLYLIKEDIKKICKTNFTIDDAWGNVYKKGDEATEHDHGGVDAFCGILYLTEGGPGTYFKEHDLTVEEKIGRYVLFHPILRHSVKPLTENIERVTMAFNNNRIKDWVKYDKIINYAGNKNEF
jgi:hypothetical protein